MRIFTSPKVLSTSVKNLAFEIDTGERFSSFRVNGKDVWVHRFYPLGPIKQEHLEEETLSIAIIRDPVDRFVSMFKNRILVRRRNTEEQFDVLPKLGLQLEPSINRLALNLGAYREAVSDIRHHSTPQSVFLGSNLAAFDHVVWFSDTRKLTAILEERLGAKLNLQHLNKSTSDFYDQLSQDAIYNLKDFYASDFDLIRQFNGTEFPRGSV